MANRLTEQKYLKLLAVYGNTPASVTLQELADRLFCTRRHMRTLLQQMQDNGWLDWQSRPGRGLRAQLHLLRTPTQLSQAEAEQLLDAGRLDEAIALLGQDKQQVTQLLRSKLGYSVQADYQRLRIPYYRTMPCLLPGTALRRSEQHLVRQVFSGLTRINEEKGEVEPDLAHRWHQATPLCWRFFLRPCVQWHDGKQVTSSDVVKSLVRSAELPLFSHLNTIRATGPLSLEIALSQPDDQLPQLLAHVDALIVRTDQLSVATPVGSGPYRVDENSDWLLRFKAFDNYYGLRGLLDEIEVFTWPDLTSTAAGAPPLDIKTSAWLSSSLSDEAYIAGLARKLTGKPTDENPEMFLERGGYFLLCDNRSVHWHTDSQRRWLRSILNPWNIQPRLQAEIRPLWVPGGSVLPDWFHTLEDGPGVSPFSGKEPHPVLRLAYPQTHPEFAMLFNIMAGLLAEHGVELQSEALPYTTWAAGEYCADIWLGTVNFTVPENWHVAAWLLGSPLLRRCAFGGETDRVNAQLSNWRTGAVSARQLIGEVTESGWLQPLFHHWMRLKGPAGVQGLHLNNLGWFDFTSAWIMPE
ncbi:SgrR family transcriptional regulator [Mangrovibacter plantisponsor]|uniref:MarR-like DNA-binding transcriptional regulator SgrR of sgrS sRNA n=1 Tax=Mangrovibacter plantisponsor TaxID=451513 RepID=A0A317Q1P3_9ENTR|nr:SgrR family transcriptional regulator [Mangrovibacter plantisponsor]PWW10108.1 MarR-like DNA-binding transcriptional regulator SgrR of sgrS sRNA [Mangrovibacter plantisponsor]